MADTDIGWNPWAALRRRPWVTLKAGVLPGGARGMLVRGAPPPKMTVWLDHRLDQRDRNAVLAHELVHEERGILYDRSTPSALVEKEEAVVRAETARRLVPLEELEKLDRMGEPVELWEVAERFDVPERVARAAVAAYFRTR